MKFSCNDLFIFPNRNIIFSYKTIIVIYTFLNLCIKVSYRPVIVIDLFSLLLLCLTQFRFDLQSTNTFYHHSSLSITYKNKNPIRRLSFAALYRNEVKFLSVSTRFHPSFRFISCNPIIIKYLTYRSSNIQFVKIRKNIFFNNGFYLLFIFR